MPYREAVETVLDTLRDFHPALRRGRRAGARRAATSTASVRKGKRGGAFCATVRRASRPGCWSTTPAAQRDVATLAHELGHAVHSLLAAGHSILIQQPSLPLAETASVFAEMLLTERLLRDERDPAARRELLAAALDDIYATVLRQAYFVLFERQAHAGGDGRPLERRAGRPLSRGSCASSSATRSRCRTSSATSGCRSRTSSRRPFYCYAYSFGQLLVLALYRRYQQEGEAFKPGYLRLLTWGGAARPVEILAEAGIDPTDRDFWRRASR